MGIKLFLIILFKLSKKLPPPSPFPSLMVNQSSFTFAWFVAWGKIRWNCRKNLEHLKNISARCFRRKEVLLLVPVSWKGGRSWRHQVSAGRACFPDTSRQTMTLWGLFLAEGKLSVPKWNSPVKQREDNFFHRCVQNWKQNYIDCVVTSNTCKKSIVKYLQHLMSQISRDWELLAEWLQLR